jgi:hypothetical protein
MATPDHTALARPSNPFGGNSIPLSGRVGCSSGAVGKSHQRVAARVAVIHAAMNDIALLDIESNQARDVVARGEAPRDGCWPLPLMCTKPGWRDTASRPVRRAAQS